MSEERMGGEGTGGGRGIAWSCVSLVAVMDEDDERCGGRGNALLGGGVTIGSPFAGVFFRTTSRRDSRFGSGPTNATTQKR